MAANPPLGTVGEVVEGEEVGRFVEVLDGSADGGGYLISTYADDQKMHDALTDRVETYDESTPSSLRRIGRSSGRIPVRAFDSDPDTQGLRRLGNDG